MMKVAELYRYPVKSLSPERVQELTITDDGKVLGDRAFAFRFASVNPDDPTQWLPKTNYASLQHIPELATLQSAFDTETSLLTITAPVSGMSVTGNPRIPSERAAFSEMLSEWHTGTESYARSGSSRKHSGFVLVGDGSLETHQYHDTKEGRTTLHSQSSVQELAKALELESLSGTRFRSNIVIEGCEAWEEFGWSNCRIQIGDDVVMKVLKPVKRCLATHANPESGVRDVDILNTLTRIIGQAVPQFAVSMTTASGSGGNVRVGDVVRILN